MAEMAAWNGHVFTVSPTLIRGFTGLTINGAVELDEQISSGQKYVVRANSSPSEISLDACLNVMTGTDAKSEAMAFVADAQAGAKDFFYMAGKKLMGCMMMLVKAQVTEIQMAPSGKWVSCTVKLTMRQCSKLDGTIAASSGESKKASVKTDKNDGTKPGEEQTKEGLDKAASIVKKSRQMSSQKLRKIAYDDGEHVIYGR